MDAKDHRCPGEEALQVHVWGSLMRVRAPALMGLLIDQ